MTPCPHATPIDDRKVRCSLANARVSIPRVCEPCQASWQEGQPPTADTLPPILVSITGGIQPVSNPYKLLASQEISPRNPLACIHVGAVDATQDEADRRCGFRRRYSCEIAPEGWTDARRCGLCPEWEE